MEGMTSGWYYSKPGGDQQSGPLSWERLFSMAQTGKLVASDLVWHPQLPRWMPASQIRELFPTPPPTGERPPAYDPGSPPPKPTGHGSRKTWIAAASLLLAVAVGLGVGLGVTRGRDHDTTTASKPHATTTISELRPTTTETPTTTTTLAPAVWTAVEPAGDQPSARTGHSLVYDPLRGQAVLFGGWNSGGLTDTWAYDPAATTWTDLAPAGEVPDKRSDYAAAYDPGGDKIILFGGAYSFIDYDDTWAYDPEANTWTVLPSSGAVPPARSGGCMVYDPVGEQMILFGGWQIGTSNDTWVYDPAANTWTELPSSGAVPPARAGHSMAYDFTSGNIILFGGETTDAYFNDTWAYDPAAKTWTELKPAGGLPAARSYFDLVYDARTQTMVLFGGAGVGDDPADPWSSGLSNDTWAYDPVSNTWTQLAPAGDVPSARRNAAAFYDPFGDRTFLFGGLAGDTLGDMWEFAPSGG